MFGEFDGPQTDTQFDERIIISFGYYSRRFSIFTNILGPSMFSFIGFCFVR